MIPQASLHSIPRRFAGIKACIYHQTKNLYDAMTREGLSDLLHAAEHSLTLRGKLKNCSNDQELIDLAKDYGFPVKLCDLQNEAESQQIEDWFRNSRISPIRK